MTNKTFLIASLVAAFVASIGLMPAMALSPLSYLSLASSTITPSPQSVTIVTGAPVASGIPNDYGYGVISANGVLAITTHAGVLDSVAQHGAASNPVFHTHLVTLKSATDCSFAAVNTASPNQVGDLKISGNTIQVTNIDSSVGTLTGPTVSFTLTVGSGGDICVNPVSEIP
jgi:hypothetical protein